ncbi:hypothetical protein [Actinomadura rudentiformis]|uniref:DUF2637 domain-containing protein n=1 Tax=Actinomadura rudentiformis TaxID=359158 RepID=A0A6H9YSV6_9ACTN|nr:hypothetical protein [Actinomadura rudentiformis]KAB2347250.1 hypothetical protein F8566_19700 [Actinomadura rudentiformis]
MDATRLFAFVASHPVPAVAGAVTAVAVLAGLGLVLWRVVRGRAADEVLTPIAALTATGVAMWGMWKFFGDVLDASGPLRIWLFAFLELAMVTSAVRARRNVREGRSAGVDGAAVWAITGLSAVLSATDAGSLRAGLLRFAAPIVAAWLWERGLAVDRRRTGKTRRISYRITLERVLVRLGLAEATDRTASDVEVHRRLTRLARAAHRVRRLRAAGDTKPRTLKRAMARLDRAMDGAVEHAGLAGDPDRRAALLDQIAALYHAPALADLTPATPWAPALTPNAAGAAPALPAAPAEVTETRTGKGRTHARTAPASPRTDWARTDPRTETRQDARTGAAGTGTLAYRDQVVAELVAEIHAAMESGDRRWTPDYPTLMKRTGYRRSWCEKAVREARNLALHTRHADDHPTPDPPTPASGTSDPDTVPDNRDDTGPGNVIELARTAGK